MISNFTEYFAGRGDRTASAVRGGTGMHHRAGAGDEASPCRNAHLCAGMPRSGGVRHCQYLSRDCFRGRADGSEPYPGGGCQRDRLPRRGDDHHHGQKPGARTYDGSRAVDNCDAGDHAGLRDVRDQSHIVRTYLQHDVRHCTDQPCTGEIQPLHRIVYGDR